MDRYKKERLGSGKFYKTKHLTQASFYSKYFGGRNE